MNTDSFEDFDNVEELPTRPVETEHAVVLPGRPRKVSNIEAARQQRERMAEIEEIADAAEAERKAIPDWTDNGRELQDEGWKSQVTFGVRIWRHPDGGGWKSEESAIHFLRSGWEPAL